MPEIKLASGAVFKADMGTSILEAAANAQISLPYSCKTGRCSTCKCKVISGVTTALQAETGLTDQERAEGWVLSCVRTADTDLMLDVDDLGGLALPPPKTVPCRISSLTKLAPDVIKVELRLPPAATFSFIPGQYVDVIGPGGVRRSYSLAKASFADRLLELHIRAVSGGAMSEYWFNQAKVNDLLRLTGPLGTFFLRAVADLDLIFLATGTGIAPVKAILESISAMPAAECPRSVTVLWGGRLPHDLYLDMGAITGNYRYVPVLSRAGDSWAGAKGHIQNVLIDFMPDLSNAAVYACGSDAMIRDAKEVLIQAGLPDRRFHSDSFVCSSS